MSDPLPLQPHQLAEPRVLEGAGGGLQSIRLQLIEGLAAKASVQRFSGEAATPG